MRYIEQLALLGRVTCRFMQTRRHSHVSTGAVAPVAMRRSRAYPGTRKQSMDTVTLGAVVPPAMRAQMQKE